MCIYLFIIIIIIVIIIIMLLLLFLLFLFLLLFLLLLIFFFFFLLLLLLLLFIIAVVLFRVQASRAELLYLLNFTCVVSLPFIVLFYGELPALEAQLSRRGTLELIISLVIMVSLAFSL